MLVQPAIAAAELGSTLSTTQEYFPVDWSRARSIPNENQDFGEEKLNFGAILTISSLRHHFLKNRALKTSFEIQNRALKTLVQILKSRSENPFQNLKSGTENPFPKLEIEC